MFVTSGIVSVVTSKNHDETIPTRLESTHHDSTTWYVDDDAVPPYFGNLERPFKDIWVGIDNGITFDGDTVFVFNGTYYENDIVYKSISIIGENRNTTFIIGNGSTPCLNITANGVNISGFTIQNNNGIGIALESSASTITNNLIYNASVDMWASEESSGNTVYRNIFIQQNATNNTHYVTDYGTNSWDNGYHFGGNYWDDYVGNDSYHGPNQDIPGSDGKGDTPYLIYGGENQDNYPFIHQDGWLDTSPISDFACVYSLPRGRIEFFDNSTDSDGYIDIWYWEFGDGDTATAQYPIHQYLPEDNTYLVHLTVTDDDGSTGTITKKIIIHPIAEAGGPYGGHVHEAIVFDGSGSYDPYGSIIISYKWDFGDGSTGSGEHPTHSYSSPKLYKVFLAVTDNIGNTGEDMALAIIDSDTVFVDDDFTRDTPGWGVDHFNNIQTAIGAAKVNGTVFVYSGIYGKGDANEYACVVVHKSIFLMGENKYTTIIDGSQFLPAQVGIEASADNVCISGFTVQNAVEYDGEGISIYYNFPYVNLSFALK